MDSNKIELKEENGIGEIKIDGIKMKNVLSYNIKRDTDIVEMTMTISVSPENFNTIKN